MRFFYELGYRYLQITWDISPRRELVDLVESGLIAPCRAIDLGNGTATTVIFLAQHGFDVNGLLAKLTIHVGRQATRCTDDKKRKEKPIMVGSNP